VGAPPLPDGWFGKQWACQTGADTARGELLLFTDADTAHGRELLTRSVNASRERGAALFTVAGRQEMETFWEKVVQPFVFAILLGRFGSLELMSRSTNPRSKIANGQFLLFTRAAYDAVGRHEGVRSHVAEDLMLAQRCAALGLPMHMVLGREHLSTRMYTSLAEIRRGWGKNVYAAGRDTMPPWLHAVARYVYPLPALMTLLPTVLLVAALAGGAGGGVLAAAAIAQGVTALFWLGIYRYTQLSSVWALSYPLAAIVFGWILGEAAWRGSAVTWKGRAYESRSA
jgi:chlorobactene glucosyltransferase